MRQEQRAGSMFPFLDRNLALSRGAQTRESWPRSYFDVTYSVLLNMGRPRYLSSLIRFLRSMGHLRSMQHGGLPNDSAAIFPEYLKSANLDAGLYYGDSMTRTHALGEIGQDTVDLAGLVLQDQYIAAINDTNTSVLDTGGAGIFGLGFPVNSFIWSESSSILTHLAVVAARTTHEPHAHGSPILEPARGTFPTFDFTPHRQIVRVKHQAHLNGQALSHPLMAPWARSFLVSSHSHLGSTHVCNTLQRNTIDRGGNLGSLA
ncbi:hypothetical protein CPB85DRAFT_1475392 [Mucidula mucida]|nr:hypothetical protein CPB85DRAFT_1475392 [Mucidula mucida]